MSKKQYTTFVYSHRELATLSHSYIAFDPWAIREKRTMHSLSHFHSIKKWIEYNNRAAK